MASAGTPGTGVLPPDLEARVQAELAPGEKLIWVGQPLASRFLVWSIPMVLMGLFVTGFAIFWISMAVSMGAPFFFPIFGLIFVVVGAGLVTSPFWMMRRARNTCYALTDRRAIVWEAGWFGTVSVYSYTPNALGRMIRRERGDGSGDLVFEEVVSVGSSYVSHGARGGGSWQTRTTITPRGFLAIPRVREVEDLIRRTLRP
jgi:hypothetical protein